MKESMSAIDWRHDRLDWEYWTTVKPTTPEEETTVFWIIEKIGIAAGRQGKDVRELKQPENRRPGSDSPPQDE